MGRKLVVLIESCAVSRRPSCRSSSTTKFSLLVNLKVAKALGLDVLLTLLARGDEVIE